MNPIQVLIVEDERIIALDLKQNLLSLGYEVCQTATTGLMAIQYAIELRPDIVLMDINLEGDMDGIEAAKQIHNEVNIPIVFLTAFAEDATLQRASAALPYGYLIKPVSSRELNATLKMATARYAKNKQLESVNDKATQALSTAALVNFWEWDVKSNQFQFYNLTDTNYSSMCFPVNETLSKFYNRIDQRDLENIQTAIEKIKNEGGSINAAFREKRNDNQTRWIEIHATKLGTDTTRIIGVEQDITERRKNEESLRQAAAVFATTSDGIIILDKALQIISINPAFSELTGYSEVEARGWGKVNALYSQPHSEQFFEQLHVVQGQHWYGHVRYKKKDGNELAVWETVNVIQSEDDQVNYVLVFSDISAILTIQERLEYLAKHDTLTNLSNRRLFMDRLNIEISRCMRTAKSLAVILIDLDHFKIVNDTLGHAAGDLLLKEVAVRLATCIRDTDTIARLGGDEFTIIISDLETIGIVDKIAQNILEHLSNPFRLGEEICYISGSIGIAIAPADGGETSLLVKNADQAMYEAKKNGRNCYRFFEPFMQKAAESRLLISNNLHKAIELNQFWIAYQPIVDLINYRIYKGEALIRWKHPKYGVMDPATFIKIAEDTGFISTIGSWTLLEVLKQVHQWRNNVPDLQISINLSPLQIRSRAAALDLLKPLDDIGISGEALAIEITENMLLEANSTVYEFLTYCREKGAQISLDDFGTGYSSLSYLSKFDMDFLKIDQSFVKTLTDGSRNFTLCEAIVAMAHKLGLKVIAEGVEMKEHVTLLKSIGCDYAQGFYFSPPVNAASFERLLMHGSALHH
ncbi:two-component system response regulator [Chitinimonas sp. PSY-7]|uniref:EAL domain-containing protein n=1 Tax=Chitinimonas sp. PSY-7 TaxID=3459088 RepID=UPI0040403D5D